MQQGITPMPDVDDFDPNADPGAYRGLGDKRVPNDDSADDGIPQPPDVEKREPIEEPEPEPSPVEEPFEPPPKPIL